MTFAEAIDLSEDLADEALDRHECPVFFTIDKVGVCARPPKN